jgi:hypothetical protein
LRARLVIGGALLLVGLVWFGQGVGLIGGSFMTGQGFWAVMGVISMILGLSLIRRRR